MYRIIFGTAMRAGVGCIIKFLNFKVVFGFGLFSRLKLYYSLQ